MTNSAAPNPKNQGRERFTRLLYTAAAENGQKMQIQEQA